MIPILKNFQDKIIWDISYIELKSAVYSFLFVLVGKQVSILRNKLWPCFKSPLALSLYRNKSVVIVIKDHYYASLFP